MGGLSDVGGVDPVGDVVVGEDQFVPVFEQDLVPSFPQGSSFFTSFALVTFHPSVSALSQREIAQYCTVFLSQLAV